MKNKIAVYLIILIAISVMINCQTGSKTPSNGKSYSGKKILFINSYHTGYDWSDKIIKGAIPEIESADIDYKIFDMDGKRNPSIDHIKEAALSAKKIIEEYKPDVVITLDDIAAKYLIVPYYKNSKIPFVFCGVNWDASVYGFPFKNVTGMIEVEYIGGLIGYMRDYAKGDRIGFISSDQEIEHKIADIYKKQLKIRIKEEVYIKTTAQWKKEFIRIQDKVDMLIISNITEIKDWDESKMKEWILQNTRIPTATATEWVTKYSLIGLTKIAEEHGEWSVKTAIKIMSGVSPRSIPIEKSKRGKFYINTTIAKKLNIKFNESLMMNAVIVK